MMISDDWSNDDVGEAVNVLRDLSARMVLIRIFLALIHPLVYGVRVYHVLVWVVALWHVAVDWWTWFDMCTWRFIARRVVLFTLFLKFLGGDTTPWLLAIMLAVRIVRVEIVIRLGFGASLLAAFCIWPPLIYGPLVYFALYHEPALWTLLQSIPTLSPFSPHPWVFSAIIASV